MILHANCFPAHCPYYANALYLAYKKILIIRYRAHPHVVFTLLKREPLISLVNNVSQVFNGCAADFKQQRNLSYTCSNRIFKLHIILFYYYSLVNLIIEKKLETLSTP